MKTLHDFDGNIIGVYDDINKILKVLLDGKIVKKVEIAKSFI